MSRIDPLVAVVDDEAPVRIALGRVLRVANYRVSEFASGDAFFSSLTAQVPACAVLDLHMPELAGLEVQKRLRAARIAIPIVFITASDDVTLDQAVREAGGTRLLRKPFASEELLAAVGVALLDHWAGASKTT